MPDIEQLRRRMQQLSALSAVFALDSEETTFDFHPKWNRNQQLGVIKNGCGDELFAHFVAAGCFIKGFAHESNMTPYNQNPQRLWPGMLDHVPSVFAASLAEPAFDIPATTFILWRCTNDNQWSTSITKYSDDDYGDGSADLLKPLTYTSREFADWLGEAYEVAVEATIIESVFDNRPLTDANLIALNPTASLHAMRNAVGKSGYPTI